MATIRHNLICRRHMFNMRERDSASRPVSDGGDNWSHQWIAFDVGSLQGPQKTATDSTCLRAFSRQSSLLPLSRGVCLLRLPMEETIRSL
ncbi:MAG: hypothetical protein ACK55Z_25640 [bacterium]